MKHMFDFKKAEIDLLPQQTMWIVIAIVVVLIILVLFSGVTSILQ